jgi:hypothetical protein
LSVKTSKENLARLKVSNGAVENNQIADTCGVAVVDAAQRRVTAGPESQQI